jgi:hypothetical protein
MDKDLVIIGLLITIIVITVFRRRVSGAAPEPRGPDTDARRAACQVICSEQHPLQAETTRAPERGPERGPEPVSVPTERTTLYNKPPVPEPVSVPTERTTLYNKPPVPEPVSLPRERPSISKSPTPESGQRETDMGRIKESDAMARERPADLKEPGPYPREPLSRPPIAAKPIGGGVQMGKIM